MREILFRGKATNRIKGRSYRTNYRNGDWVYGLLTDIENYAGFAEMTNTKGVSGIEVDKNTVGQYTGLTDENDEKIFEGDIVLFSFGDDGNRQPFYIEFVEGEFRATPKEITSKIWSIRIASYACDFEVIGNIHDNPELLGGAE